MMRSYFSGTVLCLVLGVMSFIFIMADYESHHRIKLPYAFMEKAPVYGTVLAISMESSTSYDEGNPVDETQILKGGVPVLAFYAYDTMHQRHVYVIRSFEELAMLDTHHVGHIDPEEPGYQLLHLLYFRPDGSVQEVPLSQAGVRALFLDIGRLDARVPEKTGEGLSVEKTALLADDARRPIDTVVIGPDLLKRLSQI